MVKYVLPYMSYDETPWRIEFDISGYTGDPIIIKGSSGNACILEYECSVDDPWESPIVNTKAAIRIINEGQVDVDELQTLLDMECRIVVYRSDTIKFSGWLIVDNIQQTFRATPYELQLTATSGLNILDGIDYVHQDLPGGRILLNYIRRILMHDANLGINLPIRWSARLRNSNPEINGDPFTSIIWSNNDEGFTDFNGNYKDCRYIIEGIAKAMQCRVVQDGGAWWFLDIMESLKDVIEYHECANSEENPVITTQLRECRKEIDIDYRLIREDAVLTVAPALSKVQVRYNQGHPGNIIPNGGFDRWEGEYFPISWESDGAQPTRTGSITGRSGYAVQLFGGFIGLEERFFRLKYGGFPLDASILYKSLDWGFHFMSNALGPIDEDGYIDWSKTSIKTSVKYTVDDGNGNPIDYYLNEFGYWSDKNSPANAQVAGFAMDWQRLLIVFEDKNFHPGDVVVIRVLRNGDFHTYRIDFDVFMTFDDGLWHLVDQIPNSTRNGLPYDMISVRDVTNSEYNIAYTEKRINYYKYIYFTVDKLKPGDIAAIRFSPNTNDGRVLIPDSGILNENTNNRIGVLTVEFLIQRFQSFVIDELWMAVNDNSDVYVATVENEKRSNTQEYTLFLSSAFSGFYFSNMMRNYGTSNVDYLFIDDGVQLSLTGHYARSVMKFRHKPSRILDGTISTRGKDWSYIDNYVVEGIVGKMINLGSKYNTEMNEVGLVAIEGRNQIPIGLTVEHKTSEELNRR